MWKMHDLVRFRGVDYAIHGSFFPIFAILGLLSLKETDGNAFGAFTAAYFLINVCILLHEIGHVVCGKAVGLRVRRVVMSPLGCVALFEDDGHVSPKAEAIMAAGGPAVTVAVIAALYALSDGINWSMQEAGILDMVLIGNLPVLVFNMLPIYPLDGGVLLNALARMMVSNAAAQKVSQAFSQGTALAGVAIGAAYGAWLIVFLGLAALVIGPILLAARR